MVYVPNATDTTRPIDTDPAESAQLEFRTLKAYIATLAGLGTGINLFRKNKIINGRMLVDQRNEGAVSAGIVATAVYGPDRWAGQGVAAAGVFTVQQLATGLTGASSVNFLRGKVTTIDAAPAAGSRYILRHVIEGRDCTELLWGTATAKAVALSFIAQASVPGTYAYSLINQAGTRSYLGSFTINVANTPQFFSFLIPGDTAGVWVTDTTGGVWLQFTLGAGSSFNGVAGWQAGNLYNLASSSNLMATLNATLDITDVQFEVGNAASPIEICPFIDEVLKCQRYFWKTFNPGTVPAQAVGITTGEVYSEDWAGGATVNLLIVRHPVQMRAAPTITTFNPAAANAQVRDETSNLDCSATAAAGITPTSLKVTCSANAGSTSGSTLGVHLTASAEF